MKAKLMGCENLCGLRDFTDEQREETAEVSHAFGNVAAAPADALDRLAAHTLSCASLRRQLLGWRTGLWSPVGRF